MPQYKITTCPKCKEEFKDELFFFACGTLFIKDDEDDSPYCQECPLCKQLICDNDPEYKIRIIGKEKRRIGFSTDKRSWFKKILGF